MGTAVQTPSSEFTSARNYKTNRSSHRRWILSHVFRHKILLFFFVIFQFGWNISNALIPLIVAQLVQEIDDGSLTVAVLTEHAIYALIVGIAVAFFVMMASFSIEFIGQKMERDTRDELYASLLGKSQTFHDRQKIGDIMSRVATDVRQINMMMNPGFNLVFGSILGLIIPTLFIMSINPQLLLVPGAFITVYYFSLKRYNDTLSPWSFKSRVTNAQVNSRLNETITGMALVRGSSNESREQEIFDDNIKEYQKANVKLGIIQARYYPLLLLGISTALAILHGVFLVENGTISIADFVQFILLFQLYRFPTFINVFAITALTMGTAASRRILEIINGESKIDENPDGYAAPIKGDIRFEDVTFGYTENLPVVKKISFGVKPGQTVALVGMTGSGKTTITKLLSRLYDPQNGRITVDDIDLKDWSIESLRQQMSIVEQDVFLFSRSIRDNIALGGNGMADEKIIQAAKLARAHDFISELPEGYDTEIGERGITLSGGQRQRIAIARAILKDPKILILDDASSAIDSKTEDMINQAIREVLQNRVAFLITHRIAQIRKADIIILFDQGSILEMGDHDYLIANSEKYREIFSIFDETVKFDQKEVTL